MGGSRAGQRRKRVKERSSAALQTHPGEILKEEFLDSYGSSVNRAGGVMMTTVPWRRYCLVALVLARSCAIRPETPPTCSITEANSCR